MKVLIISHLPVATQNNMGKTFLSLFSEFDKQELCQLYIYPAIPDVDRCSSYYRVTDKQILRSLPWRKAVGGEIDSSLICQTQGLYEHEEDESFYRSKKNKSPVRRLLRDAMWAMANWYNDELIGWLDREKPTCIFVAPGVAKFVYDFALRISKERRIPVVPYVCDEYYFVKEPSSPLDKLRLRLLKSKIEALMAHSAHLIVICDELKEAYSEKFGIHTSTLMTGTGYDIAEKPRFIGEPKAIHYFGNIRCNRYLSLADVGRELDMINQERGTDYKLKIYTSEKDSQILDAFDGIRSIELCGFVTGGTFDKAFHESELLLHVEAFDEDSIDFVQHSVSTKIADSLGSGIPLLAYGPDCVSSMKHLMRHDCAIIATSKAGLREMLQTAFWDENARMSTVEKALGAAKICHDSGETGKKMRRILTEVS